MERFLTTAEVCVMLGIHRASLYEARRAGRIQAVGIPGTRIVRYRLSDLVTEQPILPGNGGGRPPGRKNLKPEDTSK